MLVLVQMLQTVRIEARGSANDAMYIIALGEQQLGPTVTRSRLVPRRRRHAAEVIIESGPLHSEDEIFTYKYDPSWPVMPM